MACESSPNCGDMRRLLIFLSIVFLFNACTDKTPYPESTLDDTKVVIDITTLKENKPVFYSLPHNGKIINFFVLKISNEIQSYFDACIKCYPKKMGYRQDDEFIVCVACNVRYTMDSLKEGIGSCYPIKLKGRIKGNKYIIDKSKIIAGMIYF